MSNEPEPPGRVVIGIGNAWQGDDGAGLAVARRVREHAPAGVHVVELEGEPVSIMEAWAGVEEAYLIDAVSAGTKPGTVHRVDATDAPLPSELATASTHTFGVGETVELARALGRLPRRVIVYGIEAGDLGAGRGLSPEVASAVDEVARRILAEV